MGSFYLFGHPKWSSIIEYHFWKKAFLTHFLTHFWSQNSHFQVFLVILERQNGPPWAQNGPKTLV